MRPGWDGFAGSPLRWPHGYLDNCAPNSLAYVTIKPRDHVTLRVTVRDEKISFRGVMVLCVTVPVVSRRGAFRVPLRARRFGCEAAAAHGPAIMVRSASHAGR